MDFTYNLYRERFIPKEKKSLKNDLLLYADDDIIITSWNSFRPRPDLASGLSVYYRKLGYKISRFYGEDGSFTRWYCDIICESVDGNDITFSDLLIDVIIEADGSVHVVDLDEAAEAYEQGLITKEQLLFAMRTADTLLRDIRHGRFDALTECLKPYME
ncbi:MAG: DUF402 domain-containing protein [Lachnospiraceae bacterium]|nr:DUF402 domain-containing protein [Lachnospiraceae bacterium]